MCQEAGKGYEVQNQIFSLRSVRVGGESPWPFEQVQGGFCTTDEQQHQGGVSCAPQLLWFSVVEPYLDSSLTCLRKQHGLTHAVTAPLLVTLFH